MAKLSILAGTTSKMVDIFVQDSSSTTGAGLTGLVFNTGSLTAYYYREGAGSATAISLVTATLGTWTSSGFIVVDGTNMPGLYQVGLPNAAIAAGAKSVVVYLKGAANMAPCLLEIELTAVDNQDAVRGGMTSLPNANAEAAGGLYTRGSGAGQINQPANGQIDANTVKVSGTAQTARDLGASVLLSSGTGTGQIQLTSGNVTVVSTQLPQAIKKNTGLSGFQFVMVDGSNVPVPGLTVTAQRSIDGGAYGACANSVSAISGGTYKIDLAAADLNGNIILLVFSATGAQNRYIQIATQS